MRLKMSQSPSAVSENHEYGASEAMDLLQIDVEADVVEDRPERGEAGCSVSLFTYLFNL